MNLLKQAEADLSSILNDNTIGVGLPLTITDPFDHCVTINGLSNDISQLIDPETGQAVSGRSVTVTIVISDIINSGLDIPIGINNEGLNPWIVEFEDINGNVYKFKIKHTNPDRTLGVLTCILESYR